MNQIDDTTHIDTFNKILEDAKKPRSIRQIQEKWELSFPFKVRAVKGVDGEWFGMAILPVGVVINILGDSSKYKGHYYNGRYAVKGDIVRWEPCFL